MTSRTSRAENLSQEVLISDFTPIVPADETDWPRRALQASQRRQARVGQYSLNPRTRGFSRAIRNLWIPYSAGENTAVTTVPEPNVVQARYHAKRRVFDMFLDRDINPQKVMQWASFSADKAESTLRSRFRGYHLDAKTQVADLSTAINAEDRTYSRDSITESGVAYGGLTWYLVMLKSFSGKTDESDPLRRWVQPRWVNVVRAETEEASKYLKGINTQAFLEVFDEALLSNWCRGLYWRDVEEEYKRYLASVPLEQVPLSAYEGEYF